MKRFNAVRMALLGLGLCTAPLAAQRAEPKPLVITAVNLTAESARAAGAARKNESLARPGDVIGYALAFTNLTQGAVNNVQFTDPLPRGLVYQLGSAKADKPVRIEYSIDGGKSYAPKPMLAVVEEGRRVEKPAPAERYTHIRWTVSGPLEAGAQVTAGFHAEVSRSASEAK